MSTGAIPNILSLRGSRGGSGRSRGRGRGRGGPSGPGNGQTADTIVQGTDVDAAVSRLSAVNLGYLQDRFAELFVQNSSPVIQKRLPIINRGTYVRTSAIDTIVNAFLSPTGTETASPCRQIISLGAGTDTRSFRLFSRSDVHNVSYHEIDFDQICSKKLGIVQTATMIREVLPEVKVDEVTDRGISVWTCRGSRDTQLRAHGLDLRLLAHNAQAANAAETPELRGLQTDAPTLLLSECCLCYLEPGDAAEVVGWFTARLPNLAIVTYEPTRPDDSFGRQMVSNLAARYIRMPSLDQLKEPADQERRLRVAGMEHAKQLTVDQIWDRWIADGEKERVDSLEGLDEVEEWNLLACHYVVAWGWKGSGFDGLAQIR